MIDKSSYWNMKKKKKVLINISETYKSSSNRSQMQNPFIFHSLWANLSNKLESLQLQ